MSIGTQQCIRLVKEGASIVNCTLQVGHCQIVEPLTGHFAIDQQAVALLVLQGVGVAVLDLAQEHKSAQRHVYSR